MTLKMTFEEKKKADTQIVHFLAACGQREVRVEGKFKYLFKPNEENHVVCNVPTNSHREWMYQFEWFVPYYLHGCKAPVYPGNEPLPEGIFEEKVDFIEPEKTEAAPEQEVKKPRGRPVFKRKMTGE